DRLPGRVEREDQSYFGAAGRRWPEFLHVVVLAVVQPVNEGPAERGSMLGEHVDRLGDQVGGDWIADTDGEEPVLNLGVEAHFPHPDSISIAYMIGATVPHRNVSGRRYDQESQRRTWCWSSPTLLLVWKQVSMHQRVPATRIRVGRPTGVGDQQR